MADVVFLNLVVSNPDEVAAQFDRVKVYRSTTGSTGPWIEITNPATRILLSPGVLIYPFQDPNGSSAYFYAMAYYSSATGAESSMSDPQQGQGDAALSVLSVEQLKQNYLFGFDLVNRQGDPYPDGFFEFFIKSAVSSLEKRLDIAIRPTAITDEAHNYYPADFQNYCYVQLKRYPAVSVQQVRLIFPGNALSSARVFDPTQVILDAEHGVVQIVPALNQQYTATPLVGSNPFYPAMWGRNNYFPGAIRIDYMAGFQLGQVPPDIVDLVGKMAARGPLNILGDLLLGGGLSSTSIGIDGLSQSFSATQGYSARLSQYAAQIEEEVAMLRKVYKGIPMVVP